MKCNVISEVGKEYLEKTRSAVDGLYRKFCDDFDRDGNIILDVAPEVYEGCKPYFRKAKVETLDINPLSGAR